MAKILMVDDDRDFLESCKEVLSAEGYDVELAGSPEECEEKLSVMKPDLLILDIMMQQHDDGIALAQKLKRNNAEFPIVMLSDVSRVVGLEYGKCDEALPCKDFLNKPLKPEELIKKVKSII